MGVCYRVRQSLQICTCPRLDIVVECFELPRSQKRQETTASIPLAEPGWVNAAVHTKVLLSSLEVHLEPILSNTQVCNTALQFTCLVGFSSYASTPVYLFFAFSSIF